MAVLNNGFELGVSGATILAADPGDGDAWDVSSVPAGGTNIYDTAHVALGSLAGKFATAGTAGAADVGWIAKFGTQTDHFGRIYLYITALPAAGGQRVIQANSGGTSAAFVRAKATTGVLELVDTASTVRGTGAVAIAINQWVRIEYHITHSTTAGFIEAKLFNTATSATPSETVTSTGSFSTLASADRIFYGSTGSNANIPAFWIDQIQSNLTGYTGPATVGLPCGALLGVGR